MSGRFGQRQNTAKPADKRTIGCSGLIEKKQSLKATRATWKVIASDDRCRSWWSEMTTTMLGLRMTDAVLGRVTSSLLKFIKDTRASSLDYDRRSFSGNVS